MTYEIVDLSEFLVNFKLIILFQNNYKYTSNNDITNCVVSWILDLLYIFDKCKLESIGRVGHYHSYHIWL